MKLKTLTIALLVAAAWAMPANAAIDPSNPDWLIYRDPFGTGPTEDPSYYDQYAEVTQGDTLTLHVVVNFNTGDWTQIGSYHSAFWYVPAVVENFPTPNYAWSWMSQMANPYPADYQANGYVQLYNYNYAGSAQSVWEEPASAPFVLVSWDLKIADNAPLGTTTINMRWRSYNIMGYPYQIGAHYIETDPAFTINVLPSYITGDFDHDGDVDDKDIDALCDFIRDGLPYDPEYDISADGTSGGSDSVVDLLDLDYHVHSLVETTIGNGTEYSDFNLDGLVDTTDLTRLATNYGDDDWKWDDGNANRYIDTDIDNTDLTILATYYGFVASVDAIPEPATMSLLAAGTATMLRRRRNRPSVT